MVREDEMPASNLENQTTRSDKQFYAGIVTGLVILGIGVVTYLMDIPKIWQLTFCTGFGIILASFGTSANVKYKGITIAGAGATAVIFYLLITQFDKHDPSTIGSIYTQGEFHRATNFEIYSEEPLLGALVSNHKRYAFLIRGQEFTGPNLKVEITDENQKEYLFTVSKARVQSYLSKGKKIAWTLDKQKELLLDSETGALIQRPPATGGPDFEPELEELGFHWQRLLSPIRTALAAGLQSYKSLFAELLSENTRVRRSSRTALIRRGLNAVTPMLGRLHENSAEYRTRLGILYALAGIAQTKGIDMKAFRAKLSDRDIALVFRFVSDPDRTIRRYTTAFLYRLRDPRVADLGLRTAADKSRPQGQYNAVFLIKNVFGQLPASKQNSVSRSLRALKPELGSQTATLIDTFVTKTGSPRKAAVAARSYYVVIGSFRNLDAARKHARSLSSRASKHGVYIRPAVNGYYGVILGNRVDYKTGRALLSFARNARLAPDPYIFTADAFGKVTR